MFKDENGQYHFVTPSCSHLGCSLSFNRHTQTFDCACHGSRFSTKGQVLSEPAVEPIHTTRKVLPSKMMQNNKTKPTQQKLKKQQKENQNNPSAHVEDQKKLLFNHKMAKTKKKTTQKKGN